MAIGAHYINNLMALLLFSTPDFPFAGALFAAEAPAAVSAALYGLISCAVFWLLVRRARGSGDPMPLLPVKRAAAYLPAPLPPAGWYPDPVDGKPALRYWSGTSWTEHTHPGFEQAMEA